MNIYNKRNIVVILSLSLSVFFGCATTNNQKQLTGPKDGVKVESASKMRHIVSSRDLIIAAEKEFEKIKQNAKKTKKLAKSDDALLIKLKKILNKIQPFATSWNPASLRWEWEIILINDKQLNAFCMPGGKIAFFRGIVEELNLTDDEIGVIMGHEMAHALREHARSRIAKGQLTNLGSDIISSALGLGRGERRLLGYGSQLLGLSFSRKDEKDADLVGLDLTARAGFNPRAGLTLWEKMAKANDGSPPEWLSTHPSNKSRLTEIKKTLPAVEPLFNESIDHKK